MKEKTDFFFLNCLHVVEKKDGGSGWIACAPSDPQAVEYVITISLSLCLSVTIASSLEKPNIREME